MNVISTSGMGSKFTTDALMGMGGTVQNPNGRFYLDGSMVDVNLSSVIAESIYIKQVFRNGQSCNAAYVTDQPRGGAVRVMLESALPFDSRTLSFGGRAGTPGNAGVINTSAPNLPANQEFIVYLNQVNDQNMLFPDLQKQFLPLDVMARKIDAYAGRVAMDRDASTMAEFLAYNIFRSLNGGDNIVDQGDLNADNAYADLVNNVNGLLDDGDRLTGAFTYGQNGGRTIIGRPQFINRLFSVKSGLIVNGGDLAQEMLSNYDLDVRMSDRDYVGTGYKGFAMGFHFQVAPNYLWTLAERYLGLPAGALDSVSAIAVYYDSLAVANNIDLGVKIVDSVNVRGLMAQPLNIWGHEAFRKGYIIADSTFTNDYLTTTLGLTDETRLRPVAPSEANADTNAKEPITVPVYGDDGSIIGYKAVANVPNPNGDNIQSGLPRVRKVTASVASGAVASGTTVTLATTTAGADIYYTTNGDTPTTASAKYESALTISAAQTVKAIAVKQGNVPSAVATFTYTIQA